MTKWSLNRKIWSVVGLLTVAFVGCTVASYYGLKAVQVSMYQVTDVFLPRYRAAMTFRDDQRALNGAVFEFLSSAGEQRRATQRKKYESNLENFRKHLAEYMKIASPEGQALAEAYQKNFDVYLAATKDAMTLGEQGQSARAEARMEEVGKARADMLELVTKISELTLGRVENASQDATAIIARTILIAALSAAASIAVALLMAWAVLAALSRAINVIVNHLSQSSEQVNAAATQIASASEQLSQATTEQAASLEETAASVEEMNSMVAKNSQNASAASSTSNSSREVVKDGQRVVEKMGHSMDAINRNSDSMSDVIKVIEQIDKKTKVINDIVNKTELLSFNASVEAARAGEHGKGFAVVAEEVGNLARVSGAAAEEITTLLSTSMSTVNNLVRDTKQSVSAGAQVAGECGQLFSNIITGVTHVAGMASEIASASEEQARGVTEITKAMNQLDQMTQQNASTAEECAAAAEELSNQAEMLKAAVGNLMTTVYGGVSETVAPAAATLAKVTPLRAGARTKSATVRTSAPLRKVSGAPAFDSAGFTEV